MMMAKQYGELRTGTNLLRLLLQEALPDLVVLMHVLGDKHGPPAPLDRIWSATRQAHQPDHAFVAQATAARPASTTDLRNDRGQVAYLRRLAGPIADAYRRRQLLTLISARAPIPWLSSLHRFEITMLGRRPTSAADAFRRYSDRYASWLALRDLGQPVLVVHWEDLVDSTASTLDAIADRLGADPPRPRPLPEHPVRPCPWDHRPIELEVHPRSGDQRPDDDIFDPEDVTGALRELDLDLLASLGYSPDGRPGS